MNNVSILLFCIYGLFYSSFAFSQETLGHEREVANSHQFNLTEIDFVNEEEKFTLSGTLITPKSDFDKVVVVVPGTGKDGRNSHFKLVDSLLHHNIAVYRYDERGVGKSGGRYFNLYLYSDIRKYNDLYYCLSNLRNHTTLAGKKIGVIGHSEGGLASIEAYEKGAEIDFLVQWATPLKPYEMVKYQHETDPNNVFFRSLKMDQSQKNIFIDLVNDEVQNNLDLGNSKIRKKIDKRAKDLGYKKKEYRSYISNTLFITLLKKDYEPTYKDINIPVLYIIGSFDELVNPWRETMILANMDKRNIDVEVVEGLYHYLVDKKINEHGPDIYDIDDKALDVILQWIGGVDKSQRDIENLSSGHGVPSMGGVPFF